MVEYLYRYEVKGIQDWILATPKLREIAGGSALIEGLGKDTEFWEAQAGGKIVFAAAGGATLWFPSKEALERFAAFWPMHVARKLPGVTLVQAWDEGPRTKETLDKVFKKLGAARNLRTPALPEAGPVTLRAGKTGRIAVKRGADGYEDAASKAKDTAGSTDALAEKFGFDDLKCITDMDDFGEGYVAVVHADGNGVGRLIEGGDFDLEKMKRFSEALTNATTAAAVDAAAPLRTMAHKGIVPLRPIVLGGDDLTVILRAEDALPFTERFLKAFEQRTAEELKKAEVGVEGGLTACAGIAFVKPGWPFAQAYHLAESLCGTAKKGLTKDGKTPSGLLFHRVTTSLSPAWRDIVTDELGRGLHVGGPYKLVELDALRGAARALGAAMSRTGPREWLRLTVADCTRARAHWQRLRDVVGGRRREELAALDTALEVLGVEPANGFYGNRTGTPLLDMLTWRAIDPSLRLAADWRSDTSEGG